MGQTVLKSHKVANNHYSPDGYCGERGSDGLILPLSDASTLDEFSKDFRLSRTTEPGLSVVVPWLDPEFTLDHVKEAIVRGYSTLFVPATSLVTQLARAHAEGRLEEKLIHFTKPKLLVVDELGYLQLDSWFYPKGPQAQWNDNPDGQYLYEADPGEVPAYSLFHGVWEWFYEKVIFFF